MKNYNVLVSVEIGVGLEAKNEEEAKLLTKEIIKDEWNIDLNIDDEIISVDEVKE